MNASHETRHMLDAADLRALAEARVLLERPSLAARLSSFVGSPLEKGMARLPASWRERIGGLAHDALMKAMDTAAKTLQPAAQPASPRLHKLLGSVSGAGGGASGRRADGGDPLSTVLIMRSILDIARGEGEDDRQRAGEAGRARGVRLGGTRAATTRPRRVTTPCARPRHTVRSRAPLARGLRARRAALARLITVVAARYKVQLTQKAAGMLVPGIGAAAGATINLMFMDHFQAVSRGHFTVRRLERRYGEEAVRAAWQAVGRPHPGNRSGFL